MTSHSIIGIAHLIAGALADSGSTPTGHPRGHRPRVGLKIFGVFFLGVVVGAISVLLPLLHWAIGQMLTHALDESNKATIVVVGPGARPESEQDFNTRPKPPPQGTWAGVVPGDWCR